MRGEIQIEARSTVAVSGVAALGGSENMVPRALELKKVAENDGVVPSDSQRGPVCDPTGDKQRSR